MSSPFLYLAFGAVVTLAVGGVIIIYRKISKKRLENLSSGQEGATLSQQWKPEAPETIVEGIGEVKEQAVVASEGNGGVVSTEVLDPLPMVPPTDETKQQ